MPFLARLSYSKILLPIFAFFTGCYLTTLFKLEFCDINNLPKANSAHHSVNGQINLLLFILIMSAPGNIERRNAIRNTWLQPDRLTYEIDDAFRDTVHVPQYDVQTGFLRCKYDDIITIYRAAVFLHPHSQWTPSTSRRPVLARIWIGSNYAVLPIRTHDWNLFIDLWLAPKIYRTLPLHEFNRKPANLPICLCTINSKTTIEI